MLRVNAETRDLIVSLGTRQWERIQSALLKHYHHLSNKTLVTTQIENQSQKNQEQLSEYSEKARKMLKNKLSMYAHLTEEQKNEYSRAAAKCYIKGIFNPILRQRVATRGANTLEEAIEHAIDMELDTTNSISKSEMICRACKTIRTGIRKKIAVEKPITMK